MTKFEKDIQDASMEFHFVDAFPYSISATPIAYGPADILRMTVNFYYTRYVKSDLIGQRSQSRSGRYNSNIKSTNPADYLKEDNTRIAAELEEQVNRNPFARDTADRFGDFFINTNINLGTGANDLAGTTSNIA